MDECISLEVCIYMNRYISTCVYVHVSDSVYLNACVCTNFSLLILIVWWCLIVHNVFNHKQMDISIAYEHLYLHSYNMLIFICLWLKEFGSPMTLLRGRSKTKFKYGRDEGGRGDGESELDGMMMMMFTYIKITTRGCHKTYTLYASI
jgi:hypothetical protein